jgi:hypothetical protein
MAALLSNLTKLQQRELFADLNYLNTAEIHFFCKKHRILYAIVVETPDGTRKLLMATAALSTDQATDSMLSTVRDWSPKQEDDLTVIVCDFRGSTKPGAF